MRPNLRNFHTMHFAHCAFVISAMWIYMEFFRECKVFKKEVNLMKKSVKSTHLCICSTCIACIHLHGIFINFYTVLSSARLCCSLVFSIFALLTSTRKLQKQSTTVGYCCIPYSLSLEACTFIQAGQLTNPTRLPKDGVTIVDSSTLELSCLSFFPKNQ